ncbi:helix-turn-helix domain-containing protein [Brevibacillus sp. B_LB10_24]|uniref:helix-turn-helix domain-containing protein n=1 Tax=Brevibacillus sp. B_LB10_24 TaxID=3380645 RepID=UPI0038BAFDC6
MLGTRINSLRKEKGFSLSQLAELSDVCASCLHSIEKGTNRYPSLDLIEKIAAALQVSLDQLLHEDHVVEQEELSEEWLGLIREAMQSGVSKQQFREFLEWHRRMRDQAGQDR